MKRRKIISDSCFLIQLCVLYLSFLSGREASLMSGNVHGIPTFAEWVIVGLMSALWFGCVSYFGLRWNWRRKANENWQAPSWRANPFSGTLQFWHFAAQFFAAFALGHIITNAAQSQLPNFGLMALGTSLGIFISIQVFVRRHCLQHGETQP